MVKSLNEISGIKKKDRRLLINFNAETGLISMLSDKIIDEYNPLLPDHILLPARGGLIWGLPIYQNLVAYAKKNYLTVPKLHLFVSVYYTGEGKRSEKPEFYGLEEIIGDLESGETGLIIDDVIETGNTPHFAVEMIQERKDVEIKTAAPFYKPERTKHPDMKPYLIYLYEFNDWIVFTHEKADFQTLELAKVLKDKGQFDMLINKKGVNINDFNNPDDFYLAVLDWSSEILSRFGMPDYVCHVIDKNHLSKYNEGIFPVELNELARVYPRIEEIRSHDSYNNIRANKVPFGMIVVDNESVEFIGEEPKGRVYVVANEFSNNLPLDKILEPLKRVKDVRLFSFFPSKLPNVMSYLLKTSEHGNYKYPFSFHSSNLAVLRYFP